MDQETLYFDADIGIHVTADSSGTLNIRHQGVLKYTTAGSSTWVDEQGEPVAPSEGVLEVIRHDDGSVTIVPPKAGVG